MKELLQLYKRIMQKLKKKVLLEIYKRLRPGEPPTVESAKTLIKQFVF